MCSNSIVMFVSVRNWTVKDRVAKQNWLGPHTPKSCQHQVMLLGMMNELPISAEAAKDEAMLLRQAQEIAASFGEFKPGYFVYASPGSVETS